MRSLIRVVLASAALFSAEPALSCTSLLLGRVLFSPGSAEIGQLGIDTTTHDAHVIKSRPAKCGSVVVVSSVELDEPSFGLALAELRARAVRDVLLKAGLTDRTIKLEPQLPDHTKPRHPLDASRRMVDIYWELTKSRQECVETHTSCGRMCKMVLDDGTECYPL